jgi:hypothetical protein
MEGRKVWAHRRADHRAPAVRFAGCPTLAGCGPSLGAGLPRAGSKRLPQTLADATRQTIQDVHVTKFH